MPRLSAADVAKLAPEYRRQIESDEDGTPGRVRMSDMERAQQQYRPHQAQEANSRIAEEWRHLTDERRSARRLRGRFEDALRYVTGDTELEYVELTGDTESAAAAATAIRHMLGRLEPLL